MSTVEINRTHMSLHATISAASGSLHELQLSGRISHPHWMVCLLSGLSQSGVSVVSGRAQQTALEWDARLLLDFRTAKVQPHDLEYSALAERRPATPDMASPKLSRFELTRRVDGGLEVQVHGPDQIGFLGRFLGRLSLVMLFPVEIEINTVLGQIRDRVVLRGIGGNAPDEHARASLNTLLHSFAT